MAKKKPSSKKKTRRKSRKDKFFKTSIFKAFAGLTILGLLVALGGLLSHFLISPQKLLAPPVSAPPMPTAKKPIAEIPRFEIFPQKEIPLEKTPVIPPEHIQHGQTHGIHQREAGVPPGNGQPVEQR